MPCDVCFSSPGSVFLTKAVAGGFEKTSFCDACWIQESAALDLADLLQKTTILNAEEALIIARQQLVAVAEIIKAEREIRAVPK